MISMFLEDWFGRLLLGLIVIMVLLVIAFPFFLIQESREIEAMRVACEAKNGALLDHTTRVMVGKITTEKHQYVCVDKNLIISY